MAGRTVAFLTALTLVAAGASFAGDADPVRPEWPADWTDLWTRDRDAGTVGLDRKVRREGRASVRIDHRGQEDWSLAPRGRTAVQPGDLIEMTVWVRVQGSGDATLCAITYGPSGEVVRWTFGGRTTRDTGDWRRLRSRFVVPPGVAEIVPRMVGTGPASVWLDGFAFAGKGNVRAMRDEGLPDRLTLSNAVLEVRLLTSDGTLAVTDRRTRQVWTQRAAGEGLVVIRARAKGEDALEFDAIDARSGLDVKVGLALDGDRPELVVTLAAEGDLEQPLAWPHPFVTEAGTHLVVPMNEGISYPVTDASIEPMRLIAYGGHGICMAFWGVTDGERGHMAVLETSDDAAIRIRRDRGRLCVAPEWDGQTGRFGYARRLRYVFFDRGGHVAMCKRYRAHAKQTGLLKTLGEKRREVPAVDRLVGAVNVWCWDRQAVEIVREMQAAGIERILWSHRLAPGELRQLNDLGVLTSRYDIYQDVMDPANFKHLRGVHPGWPTEAWPDDLMLGPDGQWRRGWRVRCKDGRMRACGVLCDRRAPPYAARRIADELKTHPYRCRFIDTTTASPWRECYHPDHPMTRSESRQAKMDLLGLVSGRYKLVCGSETGHDAAVPHVHYFEGMLSLGPYRVPQAGRDMMRLWDDVPERLAKFQVGHAYRLPLWELVYHDCVVAQWYWGDYSNKLPALWDKRDLFNALYGTPPMFLFDRQRWRENRERFVESYRRTSPIARAVGYAEMTDHRFLTDDRSVQQTVFAGGVTVSVNFGDGPRRLPDGTTLPPGGVHVTGLGGKP